MSDTSSDEDFFPDLSGPDIVDDDSDSGHPLEVPPPKPKSTPIPRRRVPLPTTPPSQQLQRHPEPPPKNEDESIEIPHLKPVEILSTPAIVDTKHYACSIETCPAPARLDAIVVGTYQLDETRGSRNGDLRLYRISSSQKEDESKLLREHDRSSVPSSRLRLEHLETLEILPEKGGVLDCKWNPAQVCQGHPSLGEAHLACVTAAGTLALVTLEDDWRTGCPPRVPSTSSSESEIPEKNRGVGRTGGGALSVVAQTEPMGHLYLSLDWDNRRHGTDFAFGEENRDAHGAMSAGSVKTLLTVAQGRKKGGTIANGGRCCGGGGGGGERGGDPRIVVSEASGCVSVWRPSLGPALELRWPAHEFCGQPSEVWCAVFNPWDPNTVLSGADDCIIKRWDLRCAPTSSSSTTTTTSSSSSFSSSSSSSYTAALAADQSDALGAPLLACAVRGRHDAGVTSLAFAPCRDTPHLFASGSYDGTVRLWDLRNLSSPLGPVTPYPGHAPGGDFGGGLGGGSGGTGRVSPLAQVPVGGGVWRLKWRRSSASSPPPQHTPPTPFLPPPPHPPPSPLASSTATKAAEEERSRTPPKDSAANGASAGAEVVDPPHVLAEPSGAGGGLLLLSASMHSGVHVLRVDVPTQLPQSSASAHSPSPPTPQPPAAPTHAAAARPAVEARVVARYGGHGSMAYGADWFQLSGEAGASCAEFDAVPTGVASCSFYDHSAHFWCLPPL